MSCLSIQEEKKSRKQQIFVGCFKIASGNYRQIKISGRHNWPEQLRGI